MTKEETKVFYLCRQLCMYTDEEGVRHGRTGFKGQSWSVMSLSCMGFAGFGGSLWGGNQQALHYLAF